MSALHDVEGQQRREERQVQRPFLQPRDFLERRRVHAEVHVAGGAVDDGGAGRSIGLVVEVRELPRVLFDVQRPAIGDEGLDGVGSKSDAGLTGARLFKERNLHPIVLSVTAGATERLVVDSTHVSRS